MNDTSRAPLDLDAITARAEAALGGQRDARPGKLRIPRRPGAEVGAPRPDVLAKDVLGLVADLRATRAELVRLAGQGLDHIGEIRSLRAAVLDSAAGAPSA